MGPLRGEDCGGQDAALAGVVVDLERPAPDPAADGRVDNILEEDEGARLDEAEGEGVERGVGVRCRNRLNSSEYQAHSHEILDGARFDRCCLLEI